MNNAKVVPFKGTKEIEKPAKLKEVNTTKVTFDVKEAAAYIGVSQDLIYKMVRCNEIPHVRVRKRVLFHKESIEAWIKGETG